MCQKPSNIFGQIISKPNNCQDSFLTVSTKIGFILSALPINNQKSSNDCNTDACAKTILQDEMSQRVYRGFVFVNKFEEGVSRVRNFLYKEKHFKLYGSGSTGRLCFYEQ